MNANLQRFGVTIMALAFTLAASYAIDKRPDDALAQPLNTIPAEFQGWIGTDDPPIRGDILSALDATSYVSRTYRRGVDSVSLFIAYYANQRAGESMHSPRHCLPGSGWEFLSYAKTSLPVEGGELRINADTIQKDGASMTVLYWYQSRRRVVADEFRAKLYLIRDAVLERRTGGAIVRILCPANLRETEGAREFAAAVFPAIERAIGTERGRRLVAP
jgi:EpsI family protein